MYQKVKESEEVKDDFVHIAAHELRAPIQPILGLAASQPARCGLAVHIWRKVESISRQI